MRRLPVLALALGLLGAVVATPAFGGAVGTCRTSSPSGSTATVEVCIVEPTGVAPLTGVEPVEVTVDVSNGRRVDEVRMLFAGTTEIVDEDRPFRFFLPTDRFADGGYEIQVSALVAFSPPFSSPRTRLPVDLDNGNPGDPAPGVTYDPPVVPPSVNPVVVGAVGDGAGSETGAPAVIDLVSGWDPDLFLYLGDVYKEGTHSELASWYGPPGENFAVFDQITVPTPGNHEYLSDGGEPYFEYWGIPHFLATDVGAWRVITLDANKAYHGYDPGSPQYEWLENELATNQTRCSLVLWHQPRNTVGKYSPGADWLQPLWELMADGGVDLSLTGHDHGYQRWKPLGADNTQDPDGVRQFTSGTGGHPTYAFTRQDPRLAFGLEHTHGALRFELRPQQASWRWQRADTGAIVDEGSFSCSPIPDDEPPSVPQDVQAAAIDASTVSLTWSPSTDDVGVVRYLVFRDGERVATLGAVTDHDDTGLTPNTTYRYRVRAVDAAGNRSAGSVVAKVTTPA